MADLVQQIKSGAARSIGEEKLPLAFYGLTYLPFILAASIAYKQFSFRKQTFVSIPLHVFITTVSLLLYGLAFTHIKAAWIVSIVNIGLFAYLAYVFRDRTYAIVSVVGLVVATATSIPFLNSFGGDPLPIEFAVVSLSLLASAFLATSLPDRLINRIPLKRSPAITQTSRNTSVIETMLGFEPFGFDEWVMERIALVFGIAITGFLGILALSCIAGQLGTVGTFPQ